MQVFSDGLQGYAEGLLGVFHGNCVENVHGLQTIVGGDFSMNGKEFVRISEEDGVLIARYVLSGVGVPIEVKVRSDSFSILLRVDSEVEGYHGFSNGRHQRGWQVRSFPFDGNLDPLFDELGRLAYS